jgi:hypothetical protein
MRKKWQGCALLALSVACSGGGSDSQDPAADAQEAVDRAVEGDVRSEAAPEDACAAFQAAFGQVFEVDPDAVTFRASDVMDNTVCRATWPVANPGPGHYENEASLTIMGQSFDSPEAAVASLEGAVTSLTDGVSVEVQGEQRTVKSDFGDWVEGLGDRAITKKRSVLVASDGVRFTAGVKASADDSKNQALAIELARQLVDRI